MRRRLLSLLLSLLAGARLAGQTLYSIDGTAGPPTDEETFYVEFINRARADPTAEGVRLKTTTDAEVVSATSFFHTDLNLMAQEFAGIAAAPPVAFNAKLLNAARGHSQDQFTNQFQGHVGTDGSQPANRVTAAGYSFSTVAENVYATASSVFYGHAGFEIDWGGNDGTGMQPGRGHRVNIHSPSVREVGVGVVLGTNGGVGPQVVTQNFGTQLTGAVPLLTGVAYCDLSGDNFYSLGEGLGGLAVSVTGANFSAVTTASGAFTVPLPGNGTYAVRVSGLGIDETNNVTVTSSRNVKLDLKRTFTAPALAGPAAPPAAAASGYSVDSVPGATRYELLSYRRDTATPAEPAEDATRVTLATSAGYSAVQTAVRSQGAAAFNLRVISSTGNQTITLNRVFFGRPGAMLTFSSRLTGASSDETVHLQVSTDGGGSWSDVFTQTGSGFPGEGAFVSRSASLAALEGKIFRVRLMHSFPGGSFFTSGTLGWYVDDLKFPNCEELTADPARDLGAAPAFTFTPTAAGNYLLQVTAYNLAHRLGTSDVRLIAASNSTAPAISRQPASQSAAAGGSISLVTESPAAGATFQWQRNGSNVSGATSGTLNLANLQPIDTGIYTAVISNVGGSATSTAAIVGLNIGLTKVIGTGSELASDILHPNGKTFDQILIDGAAATMRADAGQVLRTSLIDQSGDIVQVEFAGAGTLSIVIDGASTPALPANYNQSVLYVKGHVGVVVTGADETTNLGVFSVGRGTAVNQGLFKDTVTYDGFADIAFIAISSPTGKFGGLRAANASFFATKGFTGLYAPGVNFQGPVFLNDINAFDAATPVLIIGSGSDVRITGGDLLQTNGRAVQVAGITQLKMSDGTTSHYKDASTPNEFINAKTNRGRLEQDGIDVTASVVVNPTP